MAVVANIGDGHKVVVKHTFLELDGGKEEFAARRPRSFTDSALEVKSWSSEEDEICKHSDTLSTVDTDVESSEASLSDCELHSLRSPFSWSDCDFEEEEPAVLTPPPGAFVCPMPAIAFVPVPVPVKPQAAQNPKSRTKTEPCSIPLRPRRNAPATALVTPTQSVAGPSAAAPHGLTMDSDKVGESAFTTTWAVDLRRPRGSVVVSPPFEIPGCASSIFKQIVKKRTDPSGKIMIQTELKCVNPDQEQGAVTFRIVIKGKEHLSCGPVTHDFTQAPLYLCKREWDLADIQGEAKNCFSMILQVQ